MITSKSFIYFLLQHLPQESQKVKGLVEIVVKPQFFTLSELLLGLGKVANGSD